jgi:serpin B
MDGFGPEGEVSAEAVVQGNTEFALALYEQLRGKEGNLFFSPHSISTALAMTYAGARGSTEAQMAQALHFHLDQEQLHPAFAWLEARLAEIAQKGHVQLSVANALWPQRGYPLLDAFLALTREYYGVQVTAVDYGDAETARHTINTWVEARTEGKIEELIPAGLLDPLTVLVLVNAIYFKGDWARQFDPSLTRDAPFQVAPGEHVEVAMMHQKASFGYGRGDGLQALELPYAGEDLSMIVLLPDEVDGLAALEDRLTVENLERWTGRLWPQEVEVWLPRFEITLPFRLDAALQALGMVDAFGHADFSGMDGTRSLFIGAVLHKAFVAVDEVGTEATAATAVVMTRAMVMSPPVFRADHPFLFLIRENSTGSILFLGRVVNPVQA